MSAAHRNPRGGGAEGLDFFPTRPEVVEALLPDLPSSIFTAPSTIVLDAGAGEGALLTAVHNLYPSVACLGIELHPERCEAIRKAGHRAFHANYLEPSNQQWGENVILANPPFNLMTDFVQAFHGRFTSGALRLAAWITRSGWWEGKGGKLATRAKLVDTMNATCMCGAIGTVRIILPGNPPLYECEACKNFRHALRRWTISPRPAFGKNAKGKLGNDATCYEWSILTSVRLPMHHTVRWISKERAERRAALEKKKERLLNKADSTGLEPSELQQKYSKAGSKAAETRRLKGLQTNLFGS